MNKEIICTVCPRGCHITADVEGKNVQNVLGNFCKRGYTYALNEFVSPVRILTTLVKIEGKDGELLPVRTSAPILKDKIFECMEEIKKVSVKAPVKTYDVIIKNILGTGVDIVATKDI